MTLVAVSKTVAAEALRDAVAAGLDLLGENRVQEAVAKAPEVPGARWQLVGPLQSNKARRALEVFDIDPDGGLGRPRAAARPARAGGPARDRATRSCVQVNVDLDPAKAGFAADELEAALDELLALPHLAVRRSDDGRPADDATRPRRDGRSAACASSSERVRASLAGARRRSCRWG